MKLMQELLGGAERAKALACLFEHAQREFSARELAQAAHIDAGNVSRWLRRWADAGLLDRTSTRGRYRVAARDTLRPLIAFFQQQSALAQSLRQRIDELGNEVQAAAIFGSTASGAALPDSDVDVLLLADIPRVRAQAHFKALSRELDRPVNVLAYVPKAWQSLVQEGNPLATDILDGPLIVLKGALYGATQA